MSEHANPADPKPPSVDRLSLLWRRINDHKLVQWSVAYVALAYGIQHGVTLTSEAFEWPHAVVRISMLLLVLGLPLVMTLAWYHGMRAGRRVSGPELTVITLLLVIASLLFYVFVRPSAEFAEGSAAELAVVSVLFLSGALLFVLFLRPPAEPLPVAASAEPATAIRIAAPAARGSISLAVLPLLNLSRDPDQEFFSDGMTEEITSALAKVPNLRVVARTSAFQFKGEKKDLRAIGQALSATHLIEGSVRREGNQLRITAQLIKADDGTHIWTESYNREFRGVFAVQEEIAQAIAASLQVPLGLKQGEALISNRTKDLDAYQEYLRGRALYRARSINDAIRVLESVVARDPNFAPAWGLLAGPYVLAPYFDSTIRSDPVDQARRTVQSYMAKAEKAAREAIRLDPRGASGYGGLAALQYYRYRWAEAEDLSNKSLELDPNDADLLHFQSLWLVEAGHIKRALAVRERLRTLEPFVPIYNAITAGLMQISGNDDAAISILEPISPDATRGFYRNFLLARAYAARGQFDKAADTLLLINGDLVTRRSVEDAARLLRTPKRSDAPEALPVVEGEMSFVYTHIGAAERILDFPERQLAIGGGVQGRDTLWIPLAAPARKTERFKTLVRNMGLVDYWKARGWPDLCHPVGVDDFVCD